MGDAFALRLNNSYKFGYSPETFLMSAIASLSESKKEFTLISQIQKNSIDKFHSKKIEEKSRLLALMTNKYSLNGSLNYCEKTKLCNLIFKENIENKKNFNCPKSLKFGDIFCGAGGLSSGLIKSGMSPVWAIDKDFASILTYRFNHKLNKDLKVLCGDAQEIFSSRGKFLVENKIDVLVGGPPCQGFSNANRQRLSDDPRNHLYKTFLKTLKESNAKYSILENVPGMKNASQSIEKEFKDIGYKSEFFLLDANDFGIPQKRKRLFIVSKKITNNDEDNDFFEVFKSHITLSRKPKNFNLFEHIKDLPFLEAKNIRNSTELESSKYGFSTWIHTKKSKKDIRVIFNHRSKYLNERDKKIYSLLKPGDDSEASSIQDLNPYKSRDHIFKDKFYKLHPNKPSKTITAHMYFDTHMYIHPNQARGLSPREAARVQGFDDDFIFFGFPNEWYRQIGNAVSPVVSKIIGNALQMAHRKINE